MGIPIITPSETNPDPPIVTTVVEEHIDDKSTSPTGMLNPSAHQFVPHWRDMARPTGPWIHNGIACKVTFRNTSPDELPQEHKDPNKNKQINSLALDLGDE